MSIQSPPPINMSVVRSPRWRWSERINDPDLRILLSLHAQGNQSQHSDRLVNKLIQRHVSLTTDHVIVPESTSSCCQSCLRRPVVLGLERQLTGGQVNEVAQLDDYKDANCDPGHAFLDLNTRGNEWSGRQTDTLLPNESVGTSNKSMQSTESRLRDFDQRQERLRSPALIIKQTSILRPSSDAHVTILLIARLPVLCSCWSIY